MYKNRNIIIAIVIILIIIIIAWRYRKTITKELMYPGMYGGCRMGLLRSHHGLSHPAVRGDTWRHTYGPRNGLHGKYPQRTPAECKAMKKERLGDMNWPQSGSYGNYADTYPYGNLAGYDPGWPTYNSPDDHMYWTQH